MKSDVLRLLQQNNFNVPAFHVVHTEEDMTPVFMFMLRDNKRYAVRSSFAVEDSKNASYAGQFTTLLNVDKKDIKSAVRTVFDSYRSANISEHKDALVNNSTVIIQEMVQAEYSGVIFTANPMGILNEVVVTIGRGIGTNVVEDKIHTNSYFYNIDDNLYYSEIGDDSIVFAKDKISELVDVAVRVRDLLGYEADIEFAICDDKIFILQARPITTLYAEHPIILDNSNIVESYPGISLPLTQDFVKGIYADIFKGCVLRLTDDKALVKQMDNYLSNMVDVVNGRIYYRIENWYAVLKLLPFSDKIIPIWQNMMGVSNRYVYAPKVYVSKSTKRKILKQFRHYIRKTPFYMQQLNQKFDNKYKTYKQELRDALTINETIAELKCIQKDVMEDWDITLFNDMYTFLHSYLAGKQNKKLLADVRQLDSMKPVNALQDLMKLARQNGIDSNSYKEAAKTYIDLYGDRCMGELKLETKTYRSNPELLHEYVKNNMHSDPEGVYAIQQSYRLGGHVRKAKCGIRNREISRLNRSRLFGLCRFGYLKIGQLMVIKGLLDKAEDVFYLYESELSAVDKDFRSLVAARKHRYELCEKLPAYSRIVFADGIFDKTMTAANYTSVNDDCLMGTGTSSGIVRGEVVVVKDIRDVKDVTGKIIVAVSTEPGWVFLMKQASGIIAERGSLLSHTAIVARELHKPAIVNVRNCTSLLHDGDIVEVNADLGTVTIVERGEA